ncbi:subclass B1 metallo-beta-lactamase [Psychroflexus salis]|uniref:beta-lactamase n=1 Tax=Psychroflexus salis TaxID=1526574 RepID=A0A916ZYT9_9FLAO|nr:subclass B1 metallo-beta-lactamase [Psychroflexus salis]GGE18191.1 beta-lactamase [Psychroflexus salis]
MKKYLLQISLIALIFNSCQQDQKILKAYESETLKIIQISEHVFQHVTYLDAKNYKSYPCNGMVYVKDNEVIVFDTPTNNQASLELINWIGQKNIRAVVVTHFHNDCLGGLGAFHTKGIQSYATKQTIQLAKGNNEKILPQNLLTNLNEFQIGKQLVFTKYFGEGHTKDNIVGYIPSEKTLFGGCLIKELNASKGNLADANTEDWALTVEKVKNEFTDVDYVIPGHGKSGGKELLDYTIDLFKL